MAAIVIPPVREVGRCPVCSLHAVHVAWVEVVGTAVVSPDTTMVDVQRQDRILCHRCGEVGLLDGEVAGYG